MYIVYVLYSETADKTYTGFTSNMEEHLKAHNTCATKGWTKRFRPCIVIYTEEFQDKHQALNREKYLKTGIGRTFVKEILKQYLEKNNS